MKHTYTTRQIRWHLLRLQYQVKSMQCVAKLQHTTLPSCFAFDQYSGFAFHWSHFNCGTLEKEGAVYSLADIAQLGEDTHFQIIEWLESLNAID